MLVGRNLDNTSGTARSCTTRSTTTRRAASWSTAKLDGPEPRNAEVAYNEIDGIGPTAVIAQNGIQVSRGAIADVHHNVVHDNIYTPATTTGEGDPALRGVVAADAVDHNDVYHNSDGIGLYTTSNIEVG